MPEAFDPYRQWLGIHKDEQPPHHYRLLGVRIFENDPTVIENAADRAMLHLRSLSLSPHSAHAQQLLNEVSAVRHCLLDPQQKRQYDEQLRARTPQSILGLPTLPAVPLAVARAMPLPIDAVPVPNSLAKLPSETLPRPLTPIPSKTPLSSSNRSVQNSSYGWMEVGKVVVGGLVGIVIAQLLLYYALDVDPLGVMSRSQTRKTADSRPRETPMGPTGPASPKSDERGKWPPHNESPFPPKQTLPHIPPAPPKSPVPPLNPPSTPDSNPAPKTTVPPPAIQNPPPVETVPAVVPSTKHQVPGKEERAKLEKRVRAMFPREFGKPPSRENVRELLDFLCQEAASSTVNADDRFILLSEALTCAFTVRDFSRGAEIVDHMEEAYEVDPLSLRSYFFGKVAEAATKQEDRKSLAVCAMALADQALALQQWEKAAEAVELARKQIRYLVAKDLQVAVDFRGRRLADLQGQWESIMAARKQRQTTPDDPSACLVEGRYRCFYEGDWEGGLPILAKSGDKQLSELARMDLEAGGRERAIEKGTAWYETAKNNNEYAAGLSRASYYYRLVTENVPAIEQEKIRRRLDEIDALRLPAILFSAEPDPSRLQALLATWNSD